MAKSGRPSTFTADLGRRICEHVALGKSLTTIGKMDGAPSMRTILRWLSEEETTPAIDAFRLGYTRARIASADAGYEEIRELEAQVRDKTMDPQTARVLIDSIKWRISKIKPQSYGDRTQIDLSGGVEVKQVFSLEAPDWMAEALAGRVEAPKLIAGSLAGHESPANVPALASGLDATH